MGDYISVSKNAVAEIVEKKSRFIAHMCHVETEEDAADFINSVKKKHYDARHNVYAYILSSGAKKYSDDGEPSKTGGFPVLDMLEKENITDVVCVVTRYFGGTLLGVGGLIRAYTQAAKECLKEAGICRKELCDVYKIGADYTFLEKIKHIIKSQNAIVDTIEYADRVYIYVIAPKSVSDNVKNALISEFGVKLEIEKEQERYYNLEEE